MIAVAACCHPHRGKVSEARGTAACHVNMTGLSVLAKWVCMQGSCTGAAQVASAVVEAFDSGELPRVVAEGGDAYKGWVKALGKAQKRKGKRLFMPLRLALTGTTHVRHPCLALDCCPSEHAHAHAYVHGAWEASCPVRRSQGGWFLQLM